jgi:hypothetical protein
MLFLLLFGRHVEDVIGRVWFVLLYVLGGVAAAMIQTLSIFLFDRAGMNAPLIGASGAIAALMGAFLLRFYKAKIKFAYYYVLVRLHFGHFWLPAYVVLPVWLAQQILYASLTGGDAQIAFWAHIGGFGFGVLGAFMIGLAIGKRAAEPKEIEFVAPPPPAFNVPERRAHLSALLAAGSGDAPDEARELIEHLLKADNPMLADQIYHETLAALPAFALPAATLLRLAAYHEKNWNSAQAAALYERAADAGGATAGKALLALARLRAGQMQDKASAADAYRRLLAEVGPNDPAAEVARRELQGLGHNA